jgi:hypothetical protein
VSLTCLARKRIRQEQFTKDFQEAFDEAFKELVPKVLAEIVDEHPTWLPHLPMESEDRFFLYNNHTEYDFNFSKEPKFSNEPKTGYISRRPAASA